MDLKFLKILFINVLNKFIKALNVFQGGCYYSEKMRSLFTEIRIQLVYYSFVLLERKKKRDEYSLLNSNFQILG